MSIVPELTHKDTCRIPCEEEVHRVMDDASAQLSGVWLGIRQEGVIIPVYIEDRMYDSDSGIVSLTYVDSDGRQEGDINMESPALVYDAPDLGMFFLGGVLHYAMRTASRQWRKGNVPMLLSARNMQGESVRMYHSTVRELLYLAYNNIDGEGTEAATIYGRRLAVLREEEHASLVYMGEVIGLVLSEGEEGATILLHNKLMSSYVVDTLTGGGYERNSITII